MSVKVSNRLYELYGTLTVKESYAYYVVNYVRNLALRRTELEKTTLIQVSERCQQNGEILLITPKLKYSRAKKSFGMSACTIWNDLPRELRKTDARNFQFRVKQFYVSLRNLI